MNKLLFWYHKYLNPRISIGKNVRIGNGTVFDLPLWTPFVDGKRERVPIEGGISIGNNVDIGGNNTIVWGCIRPTRIDNDVWVAHGNMIGHGCQIGRGTIIVSKVALNGLVEIGEWCFIASGVTIQPEIKIGEYSMIGTDSNVTRDIPPYSIAYGNPCKRIRENDWRPPLSRGNNHSMEEKTN